MWMRVGFSSVVLAVASLAGCGNGGGKNGQGGNGGSFLPGTPIGQGPNVPPGGTPTAQGVLKARTAVALPQGYEEPRGVAVDGSTIYVTARELATEKAVILAITGGTSQVVARGEVPGTPNAMTNPVALAFTGGTLYIADLSSQFSANASGAVLAVVSSGVAVVSAGLIDAPTGISVQTDGSLAVCGSDPTDGLGAVFKVLANGTTTLLGKGGALTSPTGIGTATNGTLFVSDAGDGLPRAQLVSVAAAGGVPAKAVDITDSCSAGSGVTAYNGSIIAAARHGSAGRLSSLTGSTEQIGFEGFPLVAPQGITTATNAVYVADQDATGPGQVLILQ